MKNTIFLFVAALLFSVAVKAQSTVDSIEAKYKLQPMPEAQTIDKVFPVLGTYQLNASADNATPSQVVVTLDSTNKGIVWVDGLPQGKLKAYLMKSPATYKIVSQKSVSGAEIPEGTMVFDPSTNTLNVEIGKAYDYNDPTAVFNAPANADVANNTGTTVVKTKTKHVKAKEKSKVWFYTAVKSETSTSTSTNAAKQ